ncbi:sorting nexin-8-like [Corticium candelabrum]|uniref:sorting nexin-8-like n=1 Tax=Corticium candelabrum TaxID=121492 RepID=UPI002E352DAD|nr:sorting nexin-8-like [Corticium candelabrum]
MAGLRGGSIPSYYRDVFEIVCPDGESKIPEKVCVRLLLKSQLPKDVLLEIWRTVDSKQQGFLNRDGLYKALALTALAQQSKPLTDKALDAYQDTELPMPTLGDLSDLRKLTLRFRRQSHPTQLGYTYDELVGLDTLHLRIIPGKKGLIMKHVEFILESHTHGTSIQRRYSDFEILHDYLHRRYPYRLIPRLPPKKVNPSSRFVEVRRRALQRYINLVCRHPTMADDDIVKFFVTFNGKDFQHNLREKFKLLPDEFATNPLAAQSRELAGLEMQTNMSSIKDQIRQMQTNLISLRETAQRMTDRSLTMADDMNIFATELAAVSSDTRTATAWTQGSDSSWSHVKAGLRSLGPHFGRLSERSKEKATQESDGLVENISMLLALINAYQDLVDRREKGVMHEHQTAIANVERLKKHQGKLNTRKDVTTAHNWAEDAEKLGNRIVMEEGYITNVEMRNYFSLYCLNMEAQVVNTNMNQFAVIMQEMVDTQLQMNEQLQAVWKDMKPITEKILPPTSSASSPLKKTEWDAAVPTF